MSVAEDPTLQVIFGFHVPETLGLVRSFSKSFACNPFQRQIGAGRVAVNPELRGWPERCTPNTTAAARVADVVRSFS